MESNSICFSQDNLIGGLINYLIIFNWLSRKKIMVLSGKLTQSEYKTQTILSFKREILYGLYSGHDQPIRQSDRHKNSKTSDHFLSKIFLVNSSLCVKKKKISFLCHICFFTIISRPTFRELVQEISKGQQPSKQNVLEKMFKY